MTADHNYTVQYVKKHILGIAPSELSVTDEQEFLIELHIFEHIIQVV